MAWGRLALGFGPWEVPGLHGPDLAPAAVGHAGVGGCLGFACLTTGLSVCVMKNRYEPVSVVGEVPSSTKAIVDAVRRGLARGG